MKEHLSCFEGKSVVSIRCGSNVHVLHCRVCRRVCTGVCVGVIVSSLLS